VGRPMVSIGDLVKFQSQQQDFKIQYLTTTSPPASRSSAVQVLKQSFAPPDFAVSFTSGWQTQRLERGVLSSVRPGPCSSSLLPEVRPRRSRHAPRSSPAPASTRAPRRRPTHLQAWSASPYPRRRHHLGGVNRACKDGNLSATWVATSVSMGWNLLPFVRGLRPRASARRACSASRTVQATAATQGRAAADDAAGPCEVPSVSRPAARSTSTWRATARTTARATKAVQSFVTAWVNELRANSFVPGVYGSARPRSGTSLRSRLDA